VASWQNAQMKARDGKRKSDIRAVQQGLEIYLQRNGKYPSADTFGQIKCNVDGDALAREWGDPFACGGMLYMQQLPSDPVFVKSGSGLASYIPRQYNYQNPKNSAYVLSANLENVNDFELARLVCVPQIGYNYCVVSP
ncbi:MAG: hypothetical protein NUV85_01440, partial [Candidatus Berkelbacteria bacterium]|nr:hypothetical protein [Candidatus Berkelbacteria bacterium]